MDVVAFPNSVGRWVKLILLPICILQIIRPNDRVERRSSNRKALQTEAILKAILIWKEQGGVMRLVKGLVDKELPLIKSTKSDKTKQCKRKVADGHLNAAIKVLTSGGLAPMNQDTLVALQSKHPRADCPTIPIGLPDDIVLAVSQDIVMQSIKAFPKGTSCGRDGFRAQHILDMLVGAGSVVSDELLSTLTRIVNLFLEGRCPAELAELVAS